MHFTYFSFKLMHSSKYNEFFFKYSKYSVSYVKCCNFNYFKYFNNRNLNSINRNVNIVFKQFSSILIFFIDSVRQKIIKNCKIALPRVSISINDVSRNNLYILNSIRSQVIKFNQVIQFIHLIKNFKHGFLVSV